MEQKKGKVALNKVSLFLFSMAFNFGLYARPDTDLVFFQHTF